MHTAVSIQYLSALSICSKWFAQQRGWIERASRLRARHRAAARATEIPMKGVWQDVGWAGVAVSEKDVLYVSNTLLQTDRKNSAGIVLWNGSLLPSSDGTRLWRLESHFTLTIWSFLRMNSFELVFCHCSPFAKISQPRDTQDVVIVHCVHHFILRSRSGFEIFNLISSYLFW